MYKVIIADDDFLVRTYLKQMIDWEAHGFTIAGDAKNGKEALRLIEQERPVLVITDICMPVLDGIGLIHEMRDRGLPGHILVLSGHDDFSYVHEAMKLGIDDYLLKDDLTPENILSFLQEHLQSVAEEQENLPVSSEELARLGKEKLRENFSLHSKRVIWQRKNCCTWPSEQAFLKHSVSRRPVVFPCGAGSCEDSSSRQMTLPRSSRHLSRCARRSSGISSRSSWANLSP